MYKQLQDILNKCIDKGWKPRGSDNIIRIEYRNYNDYNAEFRMIKNGTLGEVGYIVGTHDLFSKNSLLMEFVEWKWSLYDILLVNGHLDNGQINVIKQLGWGYAEYHYMIMGPMTAEEKIEYFIENVII